MPERKSILIRLIIFGLGTLCALLALEAGLRLFGSRYTARPPAPDGDGAFRIVCFGDSFVYGMGAPRGKSYPEQLQEILDRKGLARKVRVITYAFPGNNTSQLSTILSRDIDALKPDLLIFLGGMVNTHNLSGYHVYRHGNDLLNVLEDRAKGTRVGRLAALLMADVRARRPTSEQVARTRMIRAEETRCPLAATYFRQAENKQAENDRRKAIALAREALAADPSFVLPYGLLGVLYESEGNLPEAISCYRKYVERYPDHQKAFYLGSIYLRKDDLPEAFRAYRRGLENNVSADNNCLEGFRQLLDRDFRSVVRWQAIDFLERIRPQMDKDGRQLIDDIIANPSNQAGIDAWRAHDINRIIDECARRRVPVILMDYPEENSVLRKIAADRGLPYIDNCRVFTAVLRREPRSKYFSSEGNHCNAEGYRIMAENAAEKIRELDILR